MECSKDSKMTTDTITIIGIAITVGSSLSLLALLLLNRGNSQMDGRLERMMSDSSGESPQQAALRKRVSIREQIKSSVPKLAAHLLPGSDAKRSMLQARLSHAGLYSPFALSMFVTVKMLLMIVFPMAGLLAVSIGVLNSKFGIMAGVAIGLAGFILPSLWLDRRKARRQRLLRKALPDFLDLVVACLESGLSIDGALRRVTDELETVHPQFAFEMRLVEQEIKLGRSSNEAFLRSAERTDLEELRSLGMVLKQARELGSPVTDVLRIHSDTLRTQREHRAEEMAQKAAVKILIPTLLFIFPAMFVVLIGPAVMQIKETLLDGK